MFRFNFQSFHITHKISCQITYRPIFNSQKKFHDLSLDEEDS